MARNRPSARGHRESDGSYLRLERGLALLAWMTEQFGYKSNQEALERAKGTAEGYDAEGRSYVAMHLESLGTRARVPVGDLRRYDENVRGHLAAISVGRPTPITLRYFQQLAALYTEHFLHRVFSDRLALLQDLNDFVARRWSARPRVATEIAFEDDDVDKFAFWMATGSGKTLIMHLNYRQFLHHNAGQRLDNILLITPNEGLSRQHIAEMGLSGIPAAKFGEVGLSSSLPHAVRVIEITKLLPKRRGGGVSVPVEMFEGRNLVFVDEGHRGSGGDVWRRVRKVLGTGGFTFEYSATFGQALAATKDRDLTAEYGKAIAFDYSYRYFHRDGFGKDFRVLNLGGPEPPPEMVDKLLLGNLLSFYEQVRAYGGGGLRGYGLEKPLWVFVGKSVNAVYRQRGHDRSDVLTVLRFLDRTLADRDGWAVSTIEALLRGESGLADAGGTDVFANRFKLLHSLKDSPSELYADILAEVFHAPGTGGLRLCDVRGADGELGLKAIGADDYFGLTYIGDTAKFKKLVRSDDSSIAMEDDAVGGSLFAGINDPAARVNILVGAKKFMEGWNSWRVSNMGLLNVGKGEGSEIIQLFGRGVRLRGKGMSLKRSSAVEGAHPRNIELLETLGVFAVRADYMKKFREYLEREGVPTEDPVEFEVEVRPRREFFKKGLLVPKIPEGDDFGDEAVLMLAASEGVRVRVDVSTRAESVESTPEGLAGLDAGAGVEVGIGCFPLSLVDWEKLYLDLVAHVNRRKLRGLAIPADGLRDVVETLPHCVVVADDEVLNPRTWEDRARLQEAVTAALRSHAEKYWRREKERWENDRMVYRPLDECDPNLRLNLGPVSEEENEKQRGRYFVRVPRSEADLVCDIEISCWLGTSCTRTILESFPGFTSTATFTSRFWLRATAGYRHRLHPSTRARPTLCATSGLSGETVAATGFQTPTCSCSGTRDAGVEWGGTRPQVAGFTRISSCG